MIEVFINYAPQFGKGLLETAKITLLGGLCALSCAIVLRVLGELRFTKGIVRAYTEIILGLPILVLLYAIYFIGPQFGIRMSAFSAGILTLTLYYSPYMAEAMRAAVAAVPAGQIEAAKVIGMSPSQIALRVIMPQATALMLPALTGLMIGLAKDTAILAVISVQELSYITKQVVSRTYMPFEVWAGVALIYWAFLSLFEVGMRYLESRWTRYRSVPA